MIIIVSAENDGWGAEYPSGQHSIIPPLGTLNMDGLPTSEHDKTPTVADADRLMSEAMIGGFEMIVGKTSLSFSDTPDKQEIQDLNYNKEVSRGFDTFTGTIEFNVIEKMYKYEGAVDAGWDPAKLQYFPWSDFRKFIIWTVEEPDEYSLNASSGNKLTQHFGVTFDKVDKNIETPLKLSVPIARETKLTYVDWVAAEPATINGSTTTLPPGITTYDGVSDEQPSMISRLLASFTTTDGGVLTLTGYDWNDRLFTEQVTISGAGDHVILTKNWFQAIERVHWSGAANVTALDIKTWDTKIQYNAPVGLTQW